jgi:RNA polymerase sigma-70 factor (ECF subfamily)
MSSVSGFADQSRVGRHFPTTRWSIIAASKQTSDRSCSIALEALCGAYWYPLYSYARWQGATPENAQDLTQGFFARLLEKHYLDDFDRERGRFRTFLLAAFRHYVANERERERTQKRGSGQVLIPLDVEDAERCYRLEPSHNVTPEKIYEQRWAVTLLERALARLKFEAGSSPHFDTLRVFLTGNSPGTSYKELAARLGTTEAALKVAVHRLRRRFGVLLRKEIADTVAGPEEADDELHYLLSVLSS